MNELDPMMLRLRLKNELRRLRDATGRSQLDVARELDWSSSKVIRIEAGSVNLSTVDVKAMLALYGVTDPTQIQALAGLAKAARERPWWYDFREVISGTYGTYLGHESSASVLRMYQPTLIPGLLQTEEYAREVLVKMGSSGDRLEAQVDLRMMRQERMTGEKPTRLDFIFDESAIRRLVGGPDVMRRQLEQLRSMLGAPKVNLRIVPFTHGLHHHSIAPYVLLELPGNEMVLYIETPVGDVVSSEASAAAPGITPSVFLEAFWHFQEELDEDPENTAALIDDALRSLS